MPENSQGLEEMLDGIEPEKLWLDAPGGFEAPRIASTRNILKVNEDGGFALPDFKTYYRAAVIKLVWPWRRTHIQTVEQSCESRNKPVRLRPTDLQRECQDQSTGKERLSNQWTST